jgi:ferredoxin-type protein NapH
MKGKSRLLRTLTALAVVAAVCLGLAVHTGTGTPSAWGIQDVAAICPLGALESALASKTIVPPLFLGFAFVAVLTLVFGRAFCAWGCPVPLLRRIFKPKVSDAEAVETSCVDECASAPVEDSSASPLPSSKKRKVFWQGVPAAERGGLGDSRNWVLGGTIVSTALLGFPVFCLICPVGLTFATLIAIWRLFQFAETSLSLLVFPLILVLEVLVLRKWCHRFCPLGALLSLISRGNRTLRPQSDTEMCLHTAGKAECRRCADACPEQIDLHDSVVSAPMSECTKCRACADACPMGAISFPLLKAKKKTVPVASEPEKD